MLKALEILAVPLVLGIAGGAYFVGLHALCKKIGIDTDWHWFPQVLVGSFVLLLLVVVHYVDP